ncbi:hypothetical protein EBB07_29015 [Paenibacillaceae bacterium]|nr:hypothetical protein EBB07_29015 [Paenibacillaceae bacterium]
MTNSNLEVEMDKWFESEEGKNALLNAYADLNKEETIASDIEMKSSLKYSDGQKVHRADVFIEEGFQEEDPYGKTMYVYRINEDDTLDICLSSCFAWKVNEFRFMPDISRLIKRNGKLQNPLFDNLIEVV